VNEGDCCLLIVLSLSSPEMPCQLAGGALQLRIKSLLSDWTIISYSLTDTFCSLRDTLMIRRINEAVKVHVAFLLADGTEVGGSTMGQEIFKCAFRDEVVVVAEARCPKGHAVNVLFQKPQNYRGVMCDVCRQSVVATESGFLHCRLCKWDLCNSCDKLLLRSVLL
jgi:hypothetical protein